ncbi:MAG: transcription-repair coupling factor [Planctomycetes bacterium]|nr:transcription-repair coupling factor [Planctomycetota bacterium]
MKRFAERLASLDAFVKNLPRAGERRSIGGVVGASASLVVAAAARLHEGTILMIVPDPDDAERAALDLEYFGATARLLPPRGAQADRLRLRLEAAASARANVREVIVAPVISLLESLPDEQKIRSSVLSFKLDESLRLAQTLRLLIERGYERVPIVAKQGELSLRGDLLDFWPHAADAPIRVETFEDKIESIRRFEASTQRSIERLDFITVPLVADSELAGVDPLKFFSDHAIITFAEPARVEERGESLTLQSDYNKSALARLWDETARRARLDLSIIPGGNFGLGARGIREMGVGLKPSHDVLTTAARDGAVVVFCHNEAEAKRLRETLKDRGVDVTLPIDIRVGELSHGFTYPKLGITALTHAELIGVIAIRRPTRVKKTQESRAIEHASELRTGDFVVHAIHGVGAFRGTERLQKGTGEEENLIIEYAGETKLYVPASRIDLVGKYIGAGKANPPLDRIGGVSFARRKAQVKKAVADLAAELLETQAMREARVGFACPPDEEMQREFEAAFPFIDTEDQSKCTIELKNDLESTRPMDRLLCGDVGYGKTELAMRAAFKTVRSGRQVAVLVPTTVLAEQHLRTFRERFADLPVTVETISRFRSAKESREALRKAGEGSLDILIGTHRILSNDVRFRDLGMIIIDEEQRFGVRAKERLKKLRASVDVLSMTATPIPRTLHQALTGLRDISSLTTPPPGREAVETHISICEESELIQKAIRLELNRGGQVYFVHNRIASLEYRARELAQLVPEARYAIAHGQMGDDDLESTMTDFVKGEFEVLLSTAIVESGLDIPDANTIFIDHAEWFGLADLHQLRGRVGRGTQKGYCYLLIPGNAPLGSDAKARIRAVEELQQLGAGFDIAMRDLEIRGAGNLLGSQQSGHIAAIGYELYCKLLKATVDRIGRERREKAAREARVAAQLGIPKPAPMERAAVKALSDEDAQPLEVERPSALGLDAPPDDADNKYNNRDDAGDFDAGDGGRGIPIQKQVLDSLEDVAAGPDLELGVRAFLPEKYVPNIRMRLEVYRLMDGVRDRKSYEAVAADLRDRFGRPPEEAVRLLDIFYIKNKLLHSSIKLITYMRDRYFVDFTDHRKADAALAWFRDRRQIDEGRMHLIFDREREKSPDEAFKMLLKSVETVPRTSVDPRELRHTPPRLR